VASETKNNTRKTTNNSFATPAAATATPVKPKTAAIRATIKNVIAQFSMGGTSCGFASEIVIDESPAMISTKSIRMNPLEPVFVKPNICKLRGSQSLFLEGILRAGRQSIKANTVWNGNRFGAKNVKNKWVAL
jgi:hypothetical protein